MAAGVDFEYTSQLHVTDCIPSLNHQVPLSVKPVSSQCAGLVVDDNYLGRLATTMLAG